MTIAQPLYGHTSEDTAYLVADYPYGFRLRCQIRYWLEHKKNKGWRFVSQTTNPKAGDKWNKPKASTYVEFAAAMYLDENGHVQWSSLSQYAEAEQVLAFISKYPGADLSMLRAVAPHKVRHLNDMISGRKFMTINGVRCEVSEKEIEGWKQELGTWATIGASLVG